MKETNKGDRNVDDRAVTLLEQYDITVLRTWKGRGAILCETNQGLKILKEYAGKKEKIETQHLVLQRLQENGLEGIEQILPNKEGELLTQDYNQISYVVKEYGDGKECNVRDLSQCKEGMMAMAKFHEASLQLNFDDMVLVPNTLNKELEKHNKELKKVLSYLRKKSQKTEFEVFFLHHFGTFYEKAMEVEANVLKEAWEIPYCYCHGDYQYHNVLMNGRDPYLINFEKIHYDSRVRDINLYMRKILEKNQWSVEIGMELLAVYEQVIPLTQQERKQLYYRFAYPEKFWKIANYYYNSRKAFVSIRNMEKMEKLLQNQKDAEQFTQALEIS